MKRTMADVLISALTPRQVSPVIVMKGLCYGPMARDVRVLLLVSDTVQNPVSYYWFKQDFNGSFPNSKYIPY